MPPVAPTFSRYAEVGDIGRAARVLLERSLWPVAILLAIGSAALWFTDHPGTICFVLCSAGSLFVLDAWRRVGVGIPIIPLLALQNLVTLCLPIAVSNAVVMDYSAAQMTDAGIEVLVFSLSLVAAWRLAMTALTPSSPRCYALGGLGDRSARQLSRIAFSLIVAVTFVSFLRSVGLLNTALALLPKGTLSIVNALVSAASACGFFLGALVVGQRGTPTGARIGFWLILAFNAYTGAATLLLSSVTTLVFSVTVGLFWTSGRVPWRFLLVVLGALSFLSLGKSEMRERYWSADEEETIAISFGSIPALYQEWFSASYSVMTGIPDDRFQSASYGFRPSEVTPQSGKSLTDRINNLQNMLFVIDAVEERGIPPVYGATYSLIPALLVPRVFWPEKPRTHEGQVLLNVHFGRQSLESTFQTYIAWGLLAEAYGNFGKIFGSMLLGVVMGMLFAWVENAVARKLLLSLEGFLAFTVFASMATSFEMVASVLVTSVFQGLIPIVIASQPFVRYVTSRGETTAPPT